MRGQCLSEVFEQDKGVLRLPRKSAWSRADFRSTRKSSYSAVLVRRWPLLALLICTAIARVV